MLLRSRRGAAIAACAAGAFGLSGALVTAAHADTRPSGCSWRFKNPNPRTRHIDQSWTYMHEMSNPPTCSPHGQILGTLFENSTFIVYYADPYEPNWCYGYSWQISKTGYILCEAMGS